MAFRGYTSISHDMTFVMQWCFFTRRMPYWSMLHSLSDSFVLFYGDIFAFHYGFQVEADTWVLMLKIRLHHTLGTRLRCKLRTPHICLSTKGTSQDVNYKDEIAKSSKKTVNMILESRGAMEQDKNSFQKLSKVVINRKHSLETMKRVVDY